MTHLYWDRFQFILKNIEIFLSILYQLNIQIEDHKYRFFTTLKS